MLKGKKGMVDTIQIPVEYFIITTSDWTIFQIVEGCWWSDMKVKCLEGCETLTEEILYDEKSISISKKQWDKSKVIVYMKCTLNIIRAYLHSEIVYLITKGLIESTDVQVIVAESEEQNLSNFKHDHNDWRNPFHFNIPTQQYIEAFERKKRVERVKEVKVKKKIEKVEPKQEKPHVLVQTFYKIFGEALTKKEPTKSDVKDVFEWLGSYGENATKFLEAEHCSNLTLQAQTQFLRFPNLKKEVNKQAKKTLQKIKKRFDELRKIEGKFAVKTLYGGIEKEQKKIPPNK